MAGNIQNEIINAEIRSTGGKQTQDDIIKVNQAIKDLAAEEKNLIFIKNKLESQGKKNTAEWKKNEEALKSNRAETSRQREELGKLNSQLKLTDMTYNQLAKRAAELRGRLNNVSQGLQPEKWNALNGELNQVTTQMTRVRAGSQATGSVLSMVTKTAGLLGIGFGSMTIAVKAGQKIMEATQFTADAFERTMAGLKQSVDYFFVSISSGDWTNFWEGLRKSKQSAEELADTMDVLGDIRRGLAIEEVKLENEKNDILTKLRDKTGKVTREEKERLYARMLEIDKAYNAKVLESAYRERDGILKLYSSITGLREDRIYQIISNYRDYEGRFNQAAENLKKARQEWVSNTQIGQANQKFDMDGYLSKLSDADRLFTQLYLNYGKLNDTNLDKLKDSIIAVEKSLGANVRTELENRRVYNEIFKEQTEGEGKKTQAVKKRTAETLQAQKSLSAAIRPLVQSDVEFQEQMEKHLLETKKKLKKEEFQAFLDAQAEFEAAYNKYHEQTAEERRAASLIELQSAYDAVMANELTTNEQRLAYTEQFEQAKAEIETKYWNEKLGKLSEQAAQINALFTAGSNLVDSLRNNEMEALEQEYARKIELAGKNKTMVTRLEEEKEKKAKEIKKKYADVDFHLKILQINASTAQAIMGVWGNNTLPYPAAAIFNAIMSAVIGANGIAQAAAASKQRAAAKSLFTGGYTGPGGKYEPSDKVQFHGDEYVVASDEYHHPVVRDFIDTFVEPMRMRRLNYSPYAFSTTTPRHGYAEGGPTWTDTTARAGGLDMGAINNTLRMNTEASNRTNALLSRLLSEGVNANFDQRKINEMRQQIGRQEAGEALAKR